MAFDKTGVVVGELDANNTISARASMAFDMSLLDPRRNLCEGEHGLRRRARPAESCASLDAISTRASMAFDRSAPRAVTA